MVNKKFSILRDEKNNPKLTNVMRRGLIGYTFLLILSIILSILLPLFVPDLYSGLPLFEKYSFLKFIIYIILIETGLFLMFLPYVIKVIKNVQARKSKNSKEGIMQNIRGSMMNNFKLKNPTRFKISMFFAFGITFILFWSLLNFKFFGLLILLGFVLLFIGIIYYRYKYVIPHLYNEIFINNTKNLKFLLNIFIIYLPLLFLIFLIIIPSPYIVSSLSMELDRQMELDDCFRTLIPNLVPGTAEECVKKYIKKIKNISVCEEIDSIQKEKGVDAFTSKFVTYHDCVYIIAIETGNSELCEQLTASSNVYLYNNCIKETRFG
ncbi:MAG: hypothetical protein IH845_00665 [Nanoarchaeota archaeon]|nr:hypothetical protein [Nanoarchaeota archaeon]